MEGRTSKLQQDLETKVKAKLELKTQHPKVKLDFPAIKSQSLLELIDYQTGTVVSKTLSNSIAGTITLFAFDEGQGLSEHTSPFDAFVQILEGKAEISVSSKPIISSAGEIVVLPANQPHSLKALSSFKMLLTMIRAKQETSPE